jgi:hypothetical protein
MTTAALYARVSTDAQQKEGTIDVVILVRHYIGRAEMVGVNIASLGGTCGIPARCLLVYSGDQAVAVEHIIGCGSELRTAASG